MKRIPQERIYPHGMSPLVGMLPLLMNSLPQQVTIRYAGNLLRKGSNDAFEITNLTRQQALHDGIIIGFYYDCTIQRRNSNSQTASGVTPMQAIQRALEKVGVTFR
jgi:hypothetical protein